MARKLTPLQREKRNLNRRINYAIKKGYAFDVDTIPTQYPGESEEEYIQRIHELRGEKLWEQGEYYEYEEDEEDTYITDEMLLTIEDILNHLDVTRFRNNYQLLVGRYKRDMALGAYENALTVEGRDNLARRISEEYTEYLYEILDHAIYDSDSMQSANSNPNLQEFIEIMGDRALSLAQAEEISTDYDVPF